MSSNVVNMMTKEQLSYLKELHRTLIDVHLDKSNLFKMASIDHNGRHEYYVSREEYLEFIISVIVEELGEVFPQLDEVN